MEVPERPAVRLESTPGAGETLRQEGRAVAMAGAALVPVGELGAFGVLLERTHQAITDATARIDAEVARAVAAERERIRELADKVGAVCTGDEGTSHWFSALLAGEAPPDGPQPDGDGTDSASVKLGKVRELAESWTEADGWGELTREMRIEADCGREVLAILDGDGSGT